MTFKWLRGCKLRQYKKWYDSVNIDGVRYTLPVYDELIKTARQLQVGDFIYNIYTNKMEAIKQITEKWNHMPQGPRNARVLHIQFLTESGYVIYDLRDEDYATAHLSICSQHQVYQADCGLCNVNLYDPVFQKKHQEAVAAGKHVCENCQFVYYKTVDACPFCATRRAVK